MHKLWHEVPPTAGLPLSWHDLIPGDADLGAAIARYLALPETQIECSGTAALVVALTALRQDSARCNVILPAYTCPLVALAVAHCGLQPFCAICAPIVSIWIMNSCRICATTRRSR